MPVRRSSQLWRTWWDTQTSLYSACLASCLTIRNVLAALSSRPPLSSPESLLPSPASIHPSIAIDQGPTGREEKRSLMVMPRTPPRQHSLDRSLCTPITDCLRDGRTDGRRRGRTRGSTSRSRRKRRRISSPLFALPPSLPALPPPQSSEYYHQSRAFAKKSLDPECLARSPSRSPFHPCLSLSLSLCSFGLRRMQPRPISLPAFFLPGDDIFARPLTRLPSSLGRSRAPKGNRCKKRDDRWAPLTVAGGRAGDDYLGQRQ